MTSRALTTIFAIFATSLLGISAFTACATDDAVIGPPPTPQPEGGGDATVGDAAQDSATDSATDAADAAPDLSKLTCGELSAAYSTELQKSHTCNVNAFANECTAPRERTLGCGCNTFVNANGVGLLDQIAAQWKLDKCAVACPDVVCKEATGGTCSKDGTCGDIFGAAPNP